MRWRRYNADCVTKWARSIPAGVTVHVGDQANVTHLRKLMARAGVRPGSTPTAAGIGQFDAIIDDGGHTAEMNRASFEYLFPRALAPGGVYVIEDIPPPGRTSIDAGLTRRQRREWCKTHATECSGGMISWVMDMMSSVLGEASLAGAGTSARFRSTPNGSTIATRSPQARWVLSVEVVGRAVAVVKASSAQCEQGHAHCPERPFDPATRGRRRTARPERSSAQTKHAARRSGASRDESGALQSAQIA